MVSPDGPVPPNSMEPIERFCLCEPIRPLSILLQIFFGELVRNFLFVGTSSNASLLISKVEFSLIALTICSIL